MTEEARHRVGWTAERKSRLVRSPNLGDHNIFSAVSTVIVFVVARG
jgi:hypothetical protein